MSDKTYFEKASLSFVEYILTNKSTALAHHLNAASEPLARDHYVSFVVCMCVNREQICAEITILHP